MEKTVTIGGRNCTMKTSAALPRLYRNEFKKDMILEMNSLFTQLGKGEELLPENYNAIETIAYSMCKYADPTLPSFDEWLESFRWADVYDFLPHIIEIWCDEIAEIQPAKKNKEE